MCNKDIQTVPMSSKTVTNIETIHVMDKYNTHEQLTCKNNNFYKKRLEHQKKIRRGPIYQNRANVNQS